MREAFAVVAEEGLELMWRRHAESAQMLRDGLTYMGLGLYVTDPVSHALK